MDDIEAMLTDAKNNTLNDVFDVLRDVGVSANQIAEVQTRLAALDNHEVKF